jgi:hypothetical protein
MALFASSNPAVARVTTTGGVLAVGGGMSVVTATAFGLTAATPVAVDGAGTNATLAFYPESYVLAPGGRHHLIIRELVGPGLIEYRSKAADGARYIVSNPQVASVDADGNVTALAQGFTDITMIYGSQSYVMALRVETPVASGSLVGTGRRSGAEWRGAHDWRANWRIHRRCAGDCNYAHSCAAPTGGAAGLCRSRCIRTRTGWSAARCWALLLRACSRGESRCIPRALPRSNAPRRPADLGTRRSHGGRGGRVGAHHLSTPPIHHRPRAYLP